MTTAWDDSPVISRVVWREHAREVERLLAAERAVTAACRHAAAAAAAETRRLREALVRYGTHTAGCTADDRRLRGEAPCTCGWDAVVAPLLTRERSPETRFRMAEARPVERNANALVDDPDWCGHPMVDVQVWCCQTCGRAVTPATRTRMEQAPTVAPAGAVWVLVEGTAQLSAERYPGGGGIVGVFSDRARIGRLLIRARIIDAASLREQLARIEWFQSAFNPDCIEGWGDDEHGDEVSYRLGLHRIDGCE